MHTMQHRVARELSRSTPPLSGRNSVQRKMLDRTGPGDTGRRWHEAPERRPKTNQEVSSTHTNKHQQTAYPYIRPSPLNHTCRCKSTAQARHPSDCATTLTTLNSTSVFRWRKRVRPQIPEAPPDATADRVTQHPATASAADLDGAIPPTQEEAEASSPGARYYRGGNETHRLRCSHSRGQNCRSSTPTLGRPRAITQTHETTETTIKRARPPQRERQHEYQQQQPQSAQDQPGQFFSGGPYEPQRRGSAQERTERLAAHLRHPR
jgi:hypothetical protein